MQLTTRLGRADVRGRRVGTRPRGEGGQIRGSAGEREKRRTRRHAQGPVTRRNDRTVCSSPCSSTSPPERATAGAVEHTTLRHTKRGTASVALDGDKKRVHRGSRVGGGKRHGTQGAPGSSHARGRGGGSADYATTAVWGARSAPSPPPRPAPHGTPQRCSGPDWTAPAQRLVQPVTGRWG